MTSYALRFYTIVIAVVCAAAVIFSLRAQSSAAGWKSDSQAWQALVRTSVTHERAVARAERRMAVRYNRLVLRTRRSERKLVAALRHAQTSAATAAATQATVYRTVSAPSSGPVAAAPAPVPVAAPAPAAPTTRTS